MIYFQVHNHIDSHENRLDKNDLNEERDIDFVLSEDCIICLEKSNEKLSTLVMRDFDFEKTCQCDCYVHESCLIEWLDKSDMCPICREKWASLFVPTIDGNNTSSLFFALDDERRSNIFVIFSRNISKFFFAVYVFLVLDIIYNATIQLVLVLGNYE